MTAYADPFSVQTNTPIGRALRTIQLQADEALNWPSGYTGTAYIASINEVNPSAAGYNLALPDATGCDLGTGLMMINIGGHSFNPTNFDGTVLTILDTGDSKFLYCKDNTTAAGVWGIIAFGTTTSSADASLLAGYGLSVIDGMLNTGHQVTTSASNVAVTVGHRSKVIVNTGGSINVAFPTHTVAGNNFFFAAHNGGSGTMTLTPDAGAGDTLDGVANLELAPKESALIFCSGSSDWFTVGYGRSTQFQFTKLVKDVTAAGTFVLTSAEASNKLLQFSGAPAAPVTVEVPAVVAVYYVQNTYTGAELLELTTPLGSGVSLVSGDRAIVYCDGVDVVSAQTASISTSISVVSGSAGVPSVKFSADTDTGIFRADVNTVGLAGGGLEVARFAVAASSIIGKLGVGIVVPVSKLHVVAGANTEALRVVGTGAFNSFYDTAGTTQIGYTKGLALELRDWVVGAGIRSFYTNSTERLAIGSTGIITIGQAEVGTEILQVTGNTLLTGTLQTTDDLTVGGEAYLGSVRRGVTALGNRNSATAINLLLSDMYTLTATGNFDFSFTNAPPTGYSQVVKLKVTNGGAHTLTFPVGTKFVGGAAPSFTAAGTDLIGVMYDNELAAYVVGMVWADYK